MKNLLFAVCLFVVGTAGSVATAQSPRVFLMDGAHLGALKARVQSRDAATLQLLKSLRTKADKLLDMAPLSVMDKPSAPPGGNKHDYMSQAPYFWYDSTKPNGLPYMRKDGQRNPEIYTITDHRYMGELDNASRILALTWYLTGEEKYAEKAAMLLRHWFLDDATRMNPNLDYAQAVPGVNNGRGTGIIESIALTGIADAAGLLEGSKAWTAGDAKALNQWYVRYLDWMLTSRNGKDEHAAKNNHGTWFLVQVADFALFTGDATMARKLIEEGKEKMDGQMEKDGKMPLELARTNGLGYSTYNLQAWFKLATLAERTQLDLWNYRSKEGAGIRMAFNWLRPYALGEKKWDYEQIGGYKKDDYYALLLVAAAKYKEPQYMEYAKRVSQGEDSNAMTELLLQQ